MKNEIDFINVEGHYGGDQHWYENKFMRMAGCSAVCASEACAYLAGKFPHLRNLYPGDPKNITKQEFNAFMTQIFGYVTPGIMGMRSIRRFAKCFLSYAQSVQVDADLVLLDGKKDINEAMDFVMKAIDAGYCVMYLLLTHKDEVLDEYTWHWFTLTGYERDDDRMKVRFATWGKVHTMDFNKMWNTGTKTKGGMVVAK